jgi:hypothetical protein
MNTCRGIKLINPIGIVLGLLLLLVAPINWLEASEESWDEPKIIPSMSKMILQPIGEKMRYNGVPTRMRAYSVGVEMPKVKAFYQKWLEDSGADKVMHTKTADGYWVVGGKVGRNYHSIQLQGTSDGTLYGTQGVLISSLLPNSIHRASISQFVPIFDSNHSSTLVNRIEYIDGDVYSAISSYSFSLPTDFVEQWMMRVLKGNGWRLLSVQGEVAKHLMFQRNSENAKVTIARGLKNSRDKSAVNVIWVKG